jgi:hypothetical protein
MVTVHNYTGVPISVTFNDLLTNTPSTVILNSGVKASINNGPILIKNNYGDVLKTTIENESKVYIAAQRNDGTPIMLDTVVPRLITPLKAYRGKIIAMNISGYNIYNNKLLINALDKRVCPFGTCRVDDEIWIILLFIIVVLLATLTLITVIVAYNRSSTERSAHA